MKFPFLLLVFNMAFGFCSAQDNGSKTMYNIQLNHGIVTSTKDGNILAYGGTAQALIPVNEKNYFIAGAKVISSPFKGGPFWFFKNGFNVRGDALNYLMVLTGMRLNFDDSETAYFYAEPRAGVAFASGFAWAGIGVSPAVGFQSHLLNISLYLDYSSSSKKLNTKTKSFITIGFGIGVTF